MSSFKIHWSWEHWYEPILEFWRLKLLLDNGQLTAWRNAKQHLVRVRFKVTRGICRGDAKSKPVLQATSLSLSTLCPHCPQCVHTLSTLCCMELNLSEATLLSCLELHGAEKRIDGYQCNIFDCLPSFGPFIWGIWKIVSWVFIVAQAEEQVEQTVEQTKGQAMEQVNDQSARVHLNGLGTLDGTFGISRDGLKFLQFRGVPFAAPPIGDLRSLFVDWFGSKKLIKQDC